MLKLSFHQTEAEIMVRAAATLLFNALVRAGCPLVPLSDLAENPQYGFTASATSAPVGPKFVRITDLQDANIDWDAVPYCDCHEPSKYLLEPYDVLFARTGATTGKTHLVGQCPRAVFASYLIRLRPKPTALAEYLYSFFQSDNYWSQISDSKEGSAQPNVNGRKLMNVAVPSVGSHLQSAVREFLKAVRDRQEGLDVPLPELPPPLDEQRRIVARIEELADKTNDAKRLKQQIAAESQALCRGFFLSRSDGGAPPVAMRELVRMREPDVQVDPTTAYHFAGVYCFGRGVFSGKRMNGSEFSYQKLTRLKTGNFVYPKLMAWEGALGIVPENCDGLVVSPEFPVFELLVDRVLPEVLDVYFRSPSVWPELAAVSTGTNVRRRRLHPSAFLTFKIPLPSMESQKQLRAIKASVDTIEKLEFETGAELDALMPSILSKAFRGEL